MNVELVVLVELMIPLPVLVRKMVVEAAVVAAAGELLGVCVDVTDIRNKAVLGETEGVFEAAALVRTSAVAVVELVVLVVLLLPVSCSFRTNGSCSVSGECDG
jgi:hypothetical protein